MSGTRSWGGAFLWRVLDPISVGGVLPDPPARRIAAGFRSAMIAGAFGGPFGAVRRDFIGIVGGLAALSIGRTRLLARGARWFRGSMQYVYEKKLEGNVQPESDFPLRRRLADHATVVVEKFPEAWVEALEGGGWRESFRVYRRDPSAVHSLLFRYPLATYHVLTGVGAFVGKGLLQVEDAPGYTLCELAIMESGLSNEDKDRALEQLRPTALNPIVGYEYYIPLLVPFGGGPEDRADRRNAAGEVAGHHSSAPSVFPRRSIELAQAVIAELIGLRSMLWLYGDEATAREKNHGETVRKFGPGPARQIEQHPRYPLEAGEAEQLAAGGQRSREQVDGILDDLLRARGLASVADAVQRSDASTKPRRHLRTEGEGGTMS